MTERTANVAMHERAIARQRLAEQAIEERKSEMIVAKSNAAAIRAIVKENEGVNGELEASLHEELVAVQVYRTQISALEALIEDNKAYFDPHLPISVAPRDSQDSTEGSTQT